MGKPGVGRAEKASDPFHGLLLVFCSYGRNHTPSTPAATETAEPPWGDINLDPAVCAARLLVAPGFSLISSISICLGEGRQQLSLGLKKWWTWKIKTTLPHSTEKEKGRHIFTVLMLQAPVTTSFWFLKQKIMEGGIWEFMQQLGIPLLGRETPCQLLKQSKSKSYSPVAPGFGVWHKLVLSFWGGFLPPGTSAFLFHFTWSKEDVVG